MENSKTFCMMPWVHMHINTRGRMQACCVGDIPYGNINETSIEEIWQGEGIREFRLKMLREEMEPRCRVCYAREEANATSMRQEVNAQYGHLTALVETTDSAGFAPLTRPIYWDIRFSNLCNFRCRTCWHGASSRWFEEGKQLKRTAGKQALIEAAKDKEGLLEQLTHLLPHTEEIYFAGGEPLLMPEHDQLLAALESLGRTEVRLRYNTNFSRLDYFGREVLESWNRFEEVTVGASLDATGKRGELIRKEQNWERVIENRKRMLAICPAVKFEIHPTVSVLNVLHIPDFHREWVEAGWVGIDRIYLNLLERPDFYNIKVMPTALRSKVIARYEQHNQWLKENEAESTTIERFEEVIQFMEAGDLNHRWPAFVKECGKLDALRGESIGDILPELGL